MIDEKGKLEMNESVSKPLSVSRYEFVEELVELVNDSQLPAFVLEPILRDVYTDVKIAAQRQLEDDMKRYYGSRNSNIKEST